MSFWDTYTEPESPKEKARRALRDRRLAAVGETASRSLADDPFSDAGAALAELEAMKTMRACWTASRARE